MARAKNWTNIAVKGNAEYKARLTDLADKAKAYEGDLVRFAMDNTFGNDLSHLPATFFKSKYAQTAESATGASEADA